MLVQNHFKLSALLQEFSILLSPSIAKTKALETYFAFDCVLQFNSSLKRVKIMADQWAPVEMEVEDILEGAVCANHVQILSEKERKDNQNFEILRSSTDESGSGIARDPAEGPSNQKGKTQSPPDIMRMTIRDQLRLSGIGASGSSVFVRSSPDDEGSSSNGHANGDGDPRSIRSFQPVKMFKSVLGRSPDDNSDDPDIQPERSDMEQDNRDKKI